jgi:pyruvate dehydrogenase E2 component (dihydrolipoamide acetyltransferase)
VEIESDKATMPYEADPSGVLVRLVQEGETAVLGAPLAELPPANGSPAANGARSEPEAPGAVSRCSCCETDMCAQSKRAH